MPDTFRTQGIIENKIGHRLEQAFFEEPALFWGDMDFVKMRATIRLKRKLLTGNEPRIAAPADLPQGTRGQEAISPIIFDCPVKHFKNAFGLSRIRGKHKDDVVVSFSDRARDELVKIAHEINRDPKLSRQHHVVDGWVELGFMNDTEEPLAPAIGEAGEMRGDDAVLWWGRGNHRKHRLVDKWGDGDTKRWKTRDPLAGLGARIYVRPVGDLVLAPSPGRDVYLGGVEGEKKYWHVPLFEEIQATYDNHVHSSSGGPGTDGPPTKKFDFATHAAHHVHIARRSDEQGPIGLTWGELDEQPAPPPKEIPF